MSGAYPRVTRVTDTKTKKKWRELLQRDMDQTDRMTATTLKKKKLTVSVASENIDGLLFEFRILLSHLCCVPVPAATCWLPSLLHTDTLFPLFIIFFFGSGGIMSKPLYLIISFRMQMNPPPTQLICILNANQLRLNCAIITAMTHGDDPRLLRQLVLVLLD